MNQLTALQGTEIPLTVHTLNTAETAVTRDSEIMGLISPKDRGPFLLSRCRDLELLKPMYTIFTCV